MASFIVRPSNSEKEAFRVKLTATSMLALRLKPGDLCHLQKYDGNDSRSAIAWEASGNGMKDSIVQTSKFLQELYGFKLGDKITISRATNQLKDSEMVTFILPPGHSAMDDQSTRWWERYVKLIIATSHDCLVQSQLISFKVGSTTQDFVVDDVGVSDATICRVTDQTNFKITISASTNTSSTGVELKTSQLGGLLKEIQQVQQLINRICKPKVPARYRPIQGLLLYGAKGTGKSYLIEQVAQSGWRSVVRWAPGTKLTSSHDPQLVIVKSRFLIQPSSALRDEIEGLFDSIAGLPCLVISETRHPNDIDQALRSEGKFAAEIEIPIPTAVQRQEILEAIRGNDTNPSDEVLKQIAAKTHGYVGADLFALLRRTLELAAERQTIPQNGVDTSSPDNPEIENSIQITPEDWEEALTQIRPSALQEIFLETPNVHWTDIGGQHEIKRSLQNAVERPLHLADKMKNLGLQPKKGVLLYGPPGCSKTLLVRALATEAGLNFLAVKGAELISMYVGESERATREVFRKARAASPSIIFFDEIDAIASRGKVGGGSDLNVLTTLLNEMDGFEELRNVMVVAATNKPQNIDPALLRPGRFDNVVYIGPPDPEARTEIFQKRFERFQYQATSATTTVTLDSTIEDAKTSDAKMFAARTDGFSGAEVVAICQTAAEYALDDGRDTFTADDVSRAIGKTPKSITREMLLEFEMWNASRMR